MLSTREIVLELKMDPKEKLARLRNLRANLNEMAVRIRRYTVDPRLKAPDAGDLRKEIDDDWNQWLEIHVEVDKLPADPTQDEFLAVEKKYLELDHQVDLVQRELISDDSFRAGNWTMAWLVCTLLILVAAYIALHFRWVPELNTREFEPWAEWGPVKYAEVIFWGMFGCLCYLLFTAAYYMLRRDFDRWYQTWYIAVFLRSPFVTLILMMIVLEFVEWYGEDKSWIHNYILEEGNKFYFIVFMSFCLGLASDTASSIIRDLSDGVCEMVSGAVSRVSKKLKSAVADRSTPTEH